MSLETMEPVTAETIAPVDTRRGQSRTTTGTKNGTGRASLKWMLRIAVALPAAAVSLQHVHQTAVHFGQSGVMGWAEAAGMEAVTALALMELDEMRHQRADDPERQSGGLPWALLISAVVLSLGSNVFAVLQEGGQSRSFGGVVYGGWPTLAFLAVAWLWHSQAQRDAARAGRVAQLDAGDAAQLPADAPQWSTKRAAIQDLALRELKLGREPSPSEIARVVSARMGTVSPQYTGRIIGELKELATT